MTLPEVLLWQLLSKSPDGVRFRRQHPVGEYVIDFYCIAAKIGIEVDGKAHDMGDRPQCDARRSALLSGFGIEIVRVPAADILLSPHQVAAALVLLCKRE